MSKGYAASERGHVYAQILAALAEGPAMTYDIVMETNMDPRNASSNLSAMAAAGKVCRRKFHLSGEAAAMRGRNEVWIYSLPEHAGWAG